MPSMTSMSRFQENLGSTDAAKRSRADASSSRSRSLVGMDQQGSWTCLILCWSMNSQNCRHYPIHMQTDSHIEFVKIMSCPFAHLRMTISLLAKFQPGRFFTLELLQPLQPLKGCHWLCQSSAKVLVQAQRHLANLLRRQGLCLVLEYNQDLEFKHLRDSVGNKWCCLVDTQMPPHYLTIIFPQLLFCTSVES